MSTYYPDIMDWDEIKQLVPEEAKALEEIIVLDDFCGRYDFYTDTFEDEDGNRDFNDAVNNAWQVLCIAFEATTSVDGAGLTIQPSLDPLANPSGASVELQ